MLDASHAPAVAARFGLGTPSRLVGPVAFGRLGEIWRLDSDRGSFAVKQSRTPPDADETERDAAYQERVAAAGVPMPAVVRATDGSVLAEVEGVPLRVYRWVDVAGQDRALDPAEVGRLLAAIHAVRVETAGPVHEWYVDPVGADRWSALLDRLHVAGAPFAAALAQLAPEIVRAETLFTAPRTVQLCHRDLWADNLRRSPTGGLVALDWENSGPAGPGQELGVAAYEFGLGDPQRVRALYDAYVEAGGPGRLREPGDLTMLAAQLGHIAEIGCKRWLAATIGEERADNAGWVGEFLADPPTVARIEGILAAVS